MPLLPQEIVTVPSSGIDGIERKEESREAKRIINVSQRISVAAYETLAQGGNPQLSGKLRPSIFIELAKQKINVTQPYHLEPVREVT